MDLFLDRQCKGNEISPWQAMEELVEKLRLEARTASTLSLERHLESRNIIERRVDPDIGCDGFIEPIGSRFEDGFRLVLNDSTSPTRQRFTIAHEICHTFFYERVPELKFNPHPTDSYEEALCNYGAAALLMPAQDVLMRMKAKDVSLATLEDLGRYYNVSIETAFLRLRGLKLWNCEMTVWHRMTSGDFVVDRIHGWLKADWRWVDRSIPNEAWTQRNGSAVTGHSFVYFEMPGGYSAAKPIFFQVKRRGKSLIAIWGTKRIRDSRSRRTMFQKDRGPG